MKSRGKSGGKAELRFSSISRAEVPHVRRGKHHDLVAEILRDLENLRAGAALKVPRTAFGEAKMTNVRAALNRASARAGVEIATSSDDDYFYVWVEK